MRDQRIDESTQISSQKHVQVEEEKVQIKNLKSRSDQQIKTEVYQKYKPTNASVIHEANETREEAEDFHFNIDKASIDN